MTSTTTKTRSEQLAEKWADELGLTDAELKQQYVYYGQHCGANAGRVTGPVEDADERGELDENGKLYNDYWTDTVDMSLYTLAAIELGHNWHAADAVFFQRVARNILRKAGIDDPTQL
jgi:hypothetical protein